jgi:hypothetical protein
MTARIPLPHSGGALRDEFLAPMGLTVYASTKVPGYDLRNADFETT